MKLKTHHLAFTVLAIVGFAYVFHMWNTHGTFKSALSNLGINR